MAPKTGPLDSRRAIATDLLAQIEAQHRAAIRLEDAVRQLSRAPRERPASAPPIDLVRSLLDVMRNLFEAERALLDELERELPS